MKIEDLIKKIILSFLFIPFFSYSNPCEFKAKVTPIEFTERVESIYKDMCEWYVSTFPDNPLNPEIILNDIKFVDSWDKIDYVKDSNELSGVYYAMVEKDKNEVVVLYPPKNTRWVNTPLWVDSVLAHEFFHYFTKSCCYENIIAVERMDMALFEASAYWSQDQFLKRVSGKNLVDLIVEKEREFKEIKGFKRIAHIMYQMAPSVYLYNSVIWFDDNPQLKLSNLVDGVYTLHEMSYR